MGRTQINCLLPVTFLDASAKPVNVPVTTVNCSEVRNSDLNAYVILRNFYSGA
jgi:hypothetical protein